MKNTQEQPLKLQPASGPRTTLAEVEAGISARDIDEAIKAPTLTMAIRSLGRVVVLPILHKAIIRGMGYFGPTQRLDAEGAALWAELLLDEYPHESLADISVFLRGAALGRYGQEGAKGEVVNKGETFGALSIVKINTWFRQYLGEKADKREREMKAEQGRHLRAMGDIDQRVLDIAKPVVEKVREEQRAANVEAMLETRMVNMTRQFPVMTDQDLRDHYKLVTTDEERTAITQEADRRGLLKEPKPSAQ
jgi:hypothetical protein